VDLVDERRTVQAGDEAGGIGVGGLPCGRVIEGQLAHRSLPGRTGDLADQGGLADLPRSRDEDDARIVDPRGDQRLHVPLDQARHRDLSTYGQIRVLRPANWEQRSGKLGI
jgi:hypothetical protein